MGKGSRKKIVKARKRREDVEPLRQVISADKVGSESQGVEEDAAEGASQVAIPARTSERVANKQRKRPPPEVNPSGSIPGAPEDLDLASGEQRWPTINRSDGSPTMDGNGDIGARRNHTVDARHTGAQRGAKRVDNRGGGHWVTYKKCSQ